MNKHNKQDNSIRQLIDARLSGMQENPNFEMNVLQQVRGEIKVKKKISVGLVLAFVLVLLTLTALAVALLTARDITEQYGIPMANQSEGNSYSVEETNILLELAKENGITLSENAMASIDKDLSNGIGYYKGEMLMALAKAEFGDDPGAWTLDEQKWFDDVGVAIGIVDQPQLALPNVDEITQEQAEQIAEDYIHNRYDSSLNLLDSAKYSKGVQYLDGNADGHYPGLYWSITYAGLSVDTATYQVFINSHGEVWDCYASPVVKEGALIETIWGQYDFILGSNFGGWSQTEIQEFQKIVETSPSLNDPAIPCIKQTTYPDIPQNGMSAEEAGAIAVQAVGLEVSTYMGAVYIGDDPNPIWKVYVLVEFPDGTYDKSAPLAHFARYYIEVDSVTGEVKNIYQRDNYYDHWYLNIVLQKVIEEVDSTWVDKTPSVG